MDGDAQGIEQEQKFYTTRTVQQPNVDRSTDQVAYVSTLLKDCLVVI